MTPVTPVPERSLERHLDELRPRLRQLFAHHRIPAEDAEDLLQQSLLAYLYKQDSVGDFEKWLLGAVRNRCLMYWRSRRRRLYTAIDTAILETIAEQGAAPQEQDDFQRDLRAVIGRLSRRCRELLRLRYAQGCEPAEMAARLGYRPSGIYKTLDRCLAALSSRLVATGLVTPRRRP